MAYKLYQVLRAPVISEKSTSLQEQGKYMFNVDGEANKEQIKSAVEAIFKVKVSAVTVQNRKGKIKRFKGILGKRKDKKLAIVTLEKGQTIDLSVGV